MPRVSGPSSRGLPPRPACLPISTPHERRSPATQRMPGQAAPRFCYRRGATLLLSPPGPSPHNRSQTSTDPANHSRFSQGCCYGSRRGIPFLVVGLPGPHTTSSIATGPTQRLRPTSEVSSAPDHALEHSKRRDRARCLPRILVGPGHNCRLFSHIWLQNFMAECQANKRQEPGH